jgi:pimeloyl-ACP methyl ester carboxylesterase
MGNGKHRISRCFLLLMSVAILLPTFVSADPDRTELDVVDCWFDNVSANPAVCGWLRPQIQDSTRATKLPFAIVREQPQRHSDYAVIYLNGGPGAGSELDEKGMRQWRMWRASLNLHDDLVVYDQRGTGDAQPKLDCPGLDKVVRHALTADEPHAEREAAVESKVLECVLAVPQADRKNGTYSTLTATHDLRDLMLMLRKRFGYRGFRWYGGSYGTRLAIETLRLPELPVDRVVLDSVYPPGSNSLDMHPEHVEALIDGVDARCHELSICETGEPGIRDGLRAAMDRLKREPVRVGVSDPRATGDRIDMIVDADQLLELFVMSSYAGDWLPLLPETLGDLSKGKVDATGRTLLNNAAWMWMELDLNHVAYRLIGCRDNAPTSRAKFLKQFERYPEFADVLAPSDLAFAFCERAGITPAPLSTAWTVDVPALVVNMAVDPATPAAPVEAVAERFSQGEVRIVPGVGHGVVDRDATWATRIGKFLNGEDVLALPATLPEAGDSATP